MRINPKFVFCVFLLICFSASAMTEIKAPTLCKSNEKVIFSCPFKNGKTVSVCASPDLSKKIGEMQYRFGRIDRPLELSYPQPAGHPSAYFGFNSSHGGQWAQYELSFFMKKFRYEILVQTNSAISDDGASLRILRDRHRITDMECLFENSTNNMWLLEELSIPLYR